MGYDAAKALSFAEDFWNRPCLSANHPEGALGLSEARDVSVDRFWDKKKAPPDQFELRFVFNAKTDRDDLVAVAKPGANKLDAVLVVEGEKLEDCAHFLSECLIAGGLRIQEQWSVPMLLMALHESPVPKTLAEKVSREVAQAIIDTGLIKPGDMIGYFADGGFQHSAMFTGKLKTPDGLDEGHVTCHTKSRFMGKTPQGVTDKWFLSNPDYQFKLVHVPDEAETHRSPLADKLAGWWKVEQKSTTFFLFVATNGTAVRTATAPKNELAPSIGRSDSTGYWFASAIEAKFCFGTDGSVMTIKVLQNGQSQADVFIVRSGPAKATRLSFDPPKSR
jgi:hypothetical protein